MTKINNLVKAGFCVLLFSASNVFAHSHLHHHHRVDAHAPIGVMRDHVHQKGELMISYRLGLMKMKGARSGDSRLTSSEVLNNYMMTPSSMEMKMHMFGAMYGVSDQFTLMGMGSVVENKMKIINRANRVIHRESSAFGDVKFSGMYQFFNRNSNRLQFNLGISLPTGSLKENYRGARLAYPMQIGSGSYEALPGLSYSGQSSNYSYGAQVNGVFRLEKNDIGYRRGNSYNFTSWISRKINKSFALSSRINYEILQRTKGVDSSLNVMMTPVNNVDSTGGRRADYFVGANFIFGKNRFALEAGMPIYQKLNGTQLETDYQVIFGIQRSF